MTFQRTFQTVVLLLLAVAGLFAVARGLVYLTGDNSIVGSFTADGPRGGCPQTHNCVSTYTTEAPWAIDPIACEGSPGDAVAAAHDAVLATSGDVEVLSRGSAYVAYSRLLRFPDDVRVTTSARGLEVLSSSRLGAGDLGVNRARVERIRDTVAADPRC